MSSLDVRAIDERELAQKAAPAVKQGFRVFLSEAAFDRAVERGTSDTTREIGGVLVGEVLRDKAGPYLLVDTTVDALHAEEKGAELTFTHATWDHINQEMDSKHQGKRVVGWYHTHPGFGVFLSDRDQFIHKSFFNLPFQVAFVYDPKSREHGVFAWHDGEITRIRRYWVGEREQVWDAARTAGEPPGGNRGEPESARRPEPARNGEPALDASPSTLAMLIGVGVLLLFIGAFVGNWWGTASANRALAQVEHELAKAKVAGAQEAVASLDADLIGILRQSLGDAAMRKPIASAIAELDGLVKTLEADAATSEAAKPVVARIREARARLDQVAHDRATSEVLLAQLERASRGNGPSRVELGRDVAEQRAGLGALYAELARDVVKAGDKARAKRLLTLAARLDPGNQSRYEEQLRTFDKTASLPREQGAGPGSGGTK